MMDPTTNADIVRRGCRGGIFFWQFHFALLVNHDPAASNCRTILKPFPYVSPCGLRGSLLIHDDCMGSPSTLSCLLLMRFLQNQKPRLFFYFFFFFFFSATGLLQDAQVNPTGGTLRWWVPPARFGILQATSEDGSFFFLSQGRLPVWPHFLPSLLAFADAMLANCPPRFHSGFFEEWLTSFFLWPPVRRSGPESQKLSPLPLAFPSGSLYFQAGAKSEPSFANLLSHGQIRKRLQNFTTCPIDA